MLKPFAMRPIANADGFYELPDNTQNPPPIYVVRERVFLLNRVIFQVAQAVRAAWEPQAHLSLHLKTSSDCPDRVQSRP